VVVAELELQDFTAITVIVTTITVFTTKQVIAITESTIRYRTHTPLSIEFWLHFI